jgi:hypothetical protein
MPTGTTTATDLNETRNVLPMSPVKGVTLVVGCSTLKQPVEQDSASTLVSVASHYSLAIFGITSALNKRSERSASASDMVPRKRYVSR